MNNHFSDLMRSVHSPIHSLNNDLLKRKHIRVFIKRDDLIHPQISGNKWRKLKYQLIDARTCDKTHLVSFGGAYSNHLVALAAAGKEFGFQTTAFVRGEEDRPLNPQLLYCKAMGMELIPIDRENYRDKRLLFSKHFVQDPTAYFIDEGGAGPLALPGVAELLDELPETYDYIFIACGTGSTLAGIAQGLKQRCLLTKAEGIAVLKGAAFLKKDIESLIGSNCPFKLHLDFHQGGYAKMPAEYLAWLKLFNETGPVLDPIYTGKMMKGVVELAEKDYFPKGSSVLMIHTGGVFNFNDSCTY